MILANRKEVNEKYNNSVILNSILAAFEKQIRSDRGKSLQ